MNIANDLVCAKMASDAYGVTKHQHLPELIETIEVGTERADIRVRAGIIYVIPSGSNDGLVASYSASCAVSWSKCTR